MRRFQMSKKRYFGEGTLLTISNYVLAFFLNTIYFYICNIPLLVFYLIPYGFKVTQGSKYILIPTLIFIGPALTALYGAMGRIARYGDVSFFEDYFKSYKEGFKQSILLWIIGMIIIVIFATDRYYLSKTSFAYFFVLIFGICISLTVLCALYIFPIVSRFKLKIRDILRISVFYAVTRFKITILLVLILSLGLFIFEKSPAFTIPFFPGLFCYLSMRLLSPIFVEIEKRIIPQ